MSKIIKLQHAYTVLKMLFLKLTEEQLSAHHCTDAVNTFQAEYVRCRESNKPSTLLTVLTRMFEQMLTRLHLGRNELTALNEAVVAAKQFTRDGIPPSVQARNFLMIYA